jgi:tetratricopeptide (TPR) repeat protein
MIAERRHRPAVWLLGLVLAALSGFAPAQDTLDRNVHERIIEIQARADGGEVEAAMAELEQLAGSLDNRPLDRAVVLQRLALLQLGEERFADGLATLDRAMERVDGLPAALTASLHYVRAQVLIIEERFDEALAALDRWRAVGEPDEQPHGLFLIAYARYRLGEAEAAIDVLEGLADRPDRSDSWIELLVFLYLDQGDWESARDRLWTELERDPSAPRWWRRLASAQLGMERLDAGLADLELAEFLAPGERSDWMRRVRLWALVGAPRVAADLLDEGLDRGRVPADAEHLMLLGRLRAMARQPERAASAWTRAADAGAAAEAFRMLGRMQLDRLEYEAARISLERALTAANPADRPAIEFLLGIVAWRQGDAERARAAMSAARADDALRERSDRWLDYMERSGAVSGAGAAP